MFNDRKGEFSTPKSAKGIDFYSQEERIFIERREKMIKLSETSKSFLAGGAFGSVVGFFLAVALMVVAIYTGHLSINFTPPESTTAPTIQITALPPTEAIIATETFTPFSPNSTATVQRTPIVFTVTPPIIPNCLKHQKGVYIGIKLEDDQVMLLANDKCLMLTVNRKTLVGEPVIGILQKEKVTVLEKSFYPYKFTIPLLPDQTAEYGLYFEKGITFVEFLENNLGWAKDYKPGQYWHVMHFVPSPTATVTP